MTVDEVIRNLELCRCNDRIRGRDNCPLCTMTDGDAPDGACREVLMYEAEMALEKLRNNRTKNNGYTASWFVGMMQNVTMTKEQEEQNEQKAAAGEA